MGETDGFRQKVEPNEELPSYCQYCWHVGHSESDCHVKNPALKGKAAGGNEEEISVVRKDKQPKKVYKPVGRKPETLVVPIGQEKNDVEEGNVQVSDSHSIVGKEQLGEIERIEKVVDMQKEDNPHKVIVEERCTTREENPHSVDSSGVEKESGVSAVATPSVVRKEDGLAMIPFIGNRQLGEEDVNDDLQSEMHSSKCQKTSGNWVHGLGLSVEEVEELVSQSIVSVATEIIEHTAEKVMAEESLDIQANRFHVLQQLAEEDSVLSESQEELINRDNLSPRKLDIKRFARKGTPFVSKFQARRSVNTSNPPTLQSDD